MKKNLNQPYMIFFRQVNVLQIINIKLIVEYYFTFALCSIARISLNVCQYEIQNYYFILQ